MPALLTRRTALRGSVFGILASGLVNGPLRAAANVRIPAGPMALTRTLVRELRDGNAISVERKWRINFDQTSRYLQVNGKQLFAKVLAPAKLEPLARIEESRIEEAMFPLLLSDEGLIMAGGRDDDRDVMDEAVRIAQSMIARSDRIAKGKAQTTADLQQMQKAAKPFFDTLPKDLLFPNEQPVREIKRLTLPGGLRGEFELSYLAKAVPDYGWLDKAERRIVTRIGMSERRSVERWSLSEMGG